MREATGRKVAVNGRSVYAEESGQGTALVVFEAGSGLGRTCWDPVVPLLADRARLVAYDRAGFCRSGRTREQLGIDDMAADLVALTEAVAPESAPLVLVAHSMGGLVARRAAERLGPRLGGLLLLDPTPETAPVYDRFDQTARWVSISLGVGQLLVWFRPLAWISTGNVRRVFPPDTYKTMRAEDFTPARHRADEEGIQGRGRGRPPVPRGAAQPPGMPDRADIGLPPAQARGKPARHRRAPATVRPDAARRAVRRSRFQSLHSGRAAGERRRPGPAPPRPDQPGRRTRPP